MDNMLYIVAGLVIILLIAVLIMRRQKAQPPARSTVNSDNTRAKRSLANHEAAVADSTSAATKFDSLTIAERFMDQQRYDKAIETLERGLIQKPQDNSLSLKLLNIYAITNQTDHFYRTYDAISAYGDTATMAQAGRLKELLDQERSEATQILARNEPGSVADTYVANAEGYDGLDFDMASLQGEGLSQPQHNIHSNINNNVNSNSQQTPLGADRDDTSLELSSTAAFDSSNPSNEPAFSSDALATDNHAHHSFDLTLDDLENEVLENETEDFDKFAIEDSNNTNITNEDTNHLLTEPSFDISNSESSDLTLDDETDDSFIELDNISEDFSLSFDEPIEASSSSTVDASKLALEQTDNQASSKADNNFEDDFEDDFVLDFDDLAADSSFDTSSNDNAAISNDIEISTELTSFDFELDLEDNEQSRAVEVNPDSPLLFDDNTLFDDDFVLVDDANLADHLIAEDSAASAAMPVTTEEQKAPLDFAAQFAADFDFVNDLDNNQVTLDLAAKYLELGEYDSAKRLLSEVIIQGNSEQQIQAQELLQRTA